MKEALKHVKRLEKEAYPGFMRQLQDVFSMSGLRDYCEGDPVILTEPDGYLIYTSDEVVDVVALSPRTGAKLFREIFRAFSGKVINFDAREKTSYPMVKRMEASGWVEVLAEEAWSWGNETMYEMTVRVKERR